ncbi:AbrB/MazE/SpoVT family DNA-binding domain-containing protein [Desulfonatronovibrio hydrogenovorans]
MLDIAEKCNYGTYKSIRPEGAISMKNQIRIRDVKLVPIGNSKGIRIPKALIQKYGLANTLLIEETERGLLLRKKEEKILSWEDTYKSMAEENENWDHFNVALLDGLEDEDFEY